MSASDVMLVLGSAALIIWGAMHIYQGTPGVVAGFGEMTVDNRRILLMEWVGGGLTLISMGLLVLLLVLAGDTGSVAARLVIRFSALVLVVRAFWELMTGARVPVIQFKICVVLLLAVAVMFALATVI